MGLRPCLLSLSRFVICRQRGHAKLRVLIAQVMVDHGVVLRTSVCLLLVIVSLRVCSLTGHQL